MKVARYYNNNDIRLDEIPIPKIGDGELLIKVKRSGICGSDILEYYRFAKMKKLGVDSLVLGHEISGDIVEMGEDISNFNLGDRVFVSHHVPCFNCHHCDLDHHTACDLLHNTNYDPGGFAEYIRIPKINIEKKGVYVLDELMTYDEGVFIEPLGCVSRAQRLANIRKGQTVLILGSGVSGLLHLKLAKAKGIGKVIMTDISNYRLKKATEFGADIVINAKEDVIPEVKKNNDGRFPDCIIVCTGALSAAKQALNCIGPGTIIIFFAVPEPGINLEIPINDYWRNEVVIMTSYGAAPEDLNDAFEWIKSNKISVVDLISHHLPLQDIGEGFKIVCKADKSMKVVIDIDKIKS
jgi:L-iditol 2-dehydrogenase